MAAPACSARGRLVKRGGKRVSLAELKRALLAVEGVQDGAFLAPEDLEANPGRASPICGGAGRERRDPGGAARQLDPAFLPRRRGAA
jgi:hypothetical protein